MYISLDTETTGLKVYSGAKPFLVTICQEDGTNYHWQWFVDPESRKVHYNQHDFENILFAIKSADGIVMHNSKFDVQALYAGGILPENYEWPWHKTQDTMVLSHFLDSQSNHDLGTVAVRYGGVSIDRYEDALKEAVMQARREAANHSMKYKPGKNWKEDCWLPFSVSRTLFLSMKHQWRSICAEYANADSAATMLSWKNMEKRVKGIPCGWKTYRYRMKMVPVLQRVEKRGITVINSNYHELKGKLQKEVETFKNTCLKIANSYDYTLEIPKGSVNNSLKKFCFDVLKLPSLAKTQSGQDAFSAGVLSAWIDLLSNGPKKEFLVALREMRKRQVGVNTLEGYARHMVPSTTASHSTMHPSLNLTGTKTLRMSSNDPNEQNISKREDSNLRYIFGPLPGREWWSADAQNIELRIPSYLADETEMINLFERGSDPPFFGSYHMLVFSVLWNDLWKTALKKHGPEKAAEYCKKTYKSTQYQWVKNGNFAVQYGAIEREGGVVGTADRAYHLKGAHRTLKSRFAKSNLLNQAVIRHANKRGYIRTLSLQEMGNVGYPLRCPRSYWGDGGVIPTVPLNYMVQGTAAQWMNRAMIRVDTYFQELAQEGYHVYIIAMIHDELLMDLPAGKEKGLKVMREVKRIMESGGKAINIPTPVSVEYHPKNYGEGEVVTHLLDT